MTRDEYIEIRNQLLRDLHPPKPVYRRIGWRKGKRLYEKVVYQDFTCNRRLEIAPRILIHLKYSDPFKDKLLRGFSRRMRSLRRSTAWFDRPKGFWKGLFGL